MKNEIEGLFVKNKEEGIFVNNSWDRKIILLENKVRNKIPIYNIKSIVDSVCFVKIVFLVFGFIWFFFHWLVVIAIII